MNTTFVRSTASNLAGPGMSHTFIPAPSATSTVKGAHTTNRPNKADLELVLLRAQVRTHHRRLRESLGHGLPSGVTQRSTRAVADSFPSSRASTPSSLSYPSTPSATSAATDTDASPESPIGYASLPLPVPTGRPGQYFPEAPSPSLLPTPSFGSASPAVRPRYGAAPDGMGRGHSFVTHGDPALTPCHVFPPNLRRTPGAPVWADDAHSYFRGPVGLGIMNVDIDVDVKDSALVDQYYFETAAL